MYPLLTQINKPEDIKKLSLTELEALASELRSFIVATVAKNGGHLAPSLGTVELTLALYSVFNFPHDKLIWDVGHQAYSHKILTGRRDSFASLRQKGGITGFPNRFESKYDAFGVGHASTSISAALGMAVSRDISGRKNEVIAVIGDGALTGGEAFEALNQAGDLGKKLIVILNDNEMSIDKNVGGMSEYLSRIRLNPQYSKAKRDMGTLLQSIPHFGDKALKTARIVKDSVRAALVPGSLFEELGFHYVGPIDGHNLSLLQEILQRVRAMSGPVLIHVHTTKGKGYLPAENQPEKFHGIGKFDPATGEVIKKPGPPSYTAVFGEAIVQLADKNPNLLAITAAMPTGTGLKNFSKIYPGRFFDVGIAEEHAVTLAAGMAADGKHPVVALYSTFAQRAYDQLMHDVCLQNLPVTLCLDRAGLVGADGPTHHGAFDLSYLRHMPNMTVFVPKDEAELRDMLATAVAMDSPTAIRYPRGAGIGVSLTADFKSIPIGKAEIISENDGEVAFLAVGPMVYKAKQAAEILAESGIMATVINMRFVKPLDKTIIETMAVSKKLLVTVEENVLAGGFGSAAAEVLADGDLLKHTSLIRMGIADTFVEQGTHDELLEICNLQPEQLAYKVKERIKEWQNKD
ncbi:MAG: 1-deoxy-D-xylulose-5-phosphate synthase [Selenomonadales bacterium]|nr:1-deoxy-D-xylulose-5-phosphate synthase [Selenomonadales bacterium]